MAKTKDNAAAPAAPLPVPAFDPNKVKIARLVTLPLRKWKENEKTYLRIDGAIFTGKEITQAKGKDGEEVSKEKPADLANCTDLTTGEQVQVIIGTVLRSTLEETYPDNGYIGKAFEFVQFPKGNGKRYKTYRVAELDLS